MSQDQRQKHVRDREPLFPERCCERCDCLSRARGPTWKTWRWGSGTVTTVGRGLAQGRWGGPGQEDFCCGNLSATCPACSLGGVACVALQLQHYSHVGDLSAQGLRFCKIVSVHLSSLFAATLLENGTALETAFSCSPSLVKLRVLHLFGEAAVNLNSLCCLSIAVCWFPMTDIQINY